jgi:hypothetical protein
MEDESIIARVVVFEILKTNRRKAAQVILFKEAKKRIAPRVDNFVRKYPNCAGKYRGLPVRGLER